MIDIGPLAERAARQGVPVTQRCEPVPGTPVDFEVSADGSVRVLTEGWEAVVEDGKITGFRPAPGQMPPDPVSASEMGVVAIHEMYKSLRQGGWGILAAAAYLAATVRYNGEDPQEQS